LATAAGAQRTPSASSARVVDRVGLAPTVSLADGSGSHTIGPTCSPCTSLAHLRPSSQRFGGELEQACLPCAHALIKLAVAAHATQHTHLRPVHNTAHRPSQLSTCATSVNQHLPHSVKYSKAVPTTVDNTTHFNQLAPSTCTTAVTTTCLPQQVTPLHEPQLRWESRSFWEDWA
jgi:hypothetical protein